MNYSVAMTQEVDDRLVDHLSRADGQEDLCFAVWQPSKGRLRFTALVSDVLLPIKGDRNVHGNASFNPQYVERAIDAALEAGGGIAFLHSHPAAGWQGMSDDDIQAEERLAPTVQAATGLPLVGLTVAAQDGAWSARFWRRIAPRQYARHWAESVRVVGERLTVHFNDHILRHPEHRESQVRTVSAWGPEAQATIARLRIGIIGLGSVGSIVAEALARIGIQRVQLIDNQNLEELNLDRTLHATATDARDERAKVDISADALRASATAEGFTVAADKLSVCEEDGYRLALDCDMLFSCVDRPWPRSILNFVAYAHLIPVVDGGIFVGRTKVKRLRSADWKAHVVGPSHRCLLCLGQYDPAFVAVEQKGDLDDPTYLETLPDEHPVRRNENVFAFSLAVASLEVLQFIMMAVGPLGLGPRGPQNYHLLTGEIDIGSTSCDAGCVFPDLIAVGETRASGVVSSTSTETPVRSGWRTRLRRLWSLVSGPGRP